MRLIKHGDETRKFQATCEKVINYFISGTAFEEKLATTIQPPHLKPHKIFLHTMMQLEVQATQAYELSASLDDLDIRVVFEDISWRLGRRMGQEQTVRSNGLQSNPPTWTLCQAPAQTIGASYERLSL